MAIIGLQARTQIVLTSTFGALKSPISSKTKCPGNPDTRILTSETVFTSRLETGRKMGQSSALAAAVRRRTTFAKCDRREPKEGLWPWNACLCGTSPKVKF